MNIPGEGAPNPSFMDEIAELQTPADKTKFDVGANFQNLQQNTFTTPETLNDDQKKNLVEGIVGIAKIDALKNLLKLSQERSPDSALTSYLSRWMTILASESQNLERDQRKGQDKKYTDQSLKNLSMTVDIMVNGLTDPDEKISNAKKVLDRNRLNDFPGADTHLAHAEQRFTDTQQIKKDLLELLGDDGIEKLKQMFGKEAPSEE